MCYPSPHACDNASSKVFIVPHLCIYDNKLQYIWCSDLIPPYVETAMPRIAVTSCLFLQAQYNVTTTTMLNADEVLNEIIRILPIKRVTFVQKG